MPWRSAADRSMDGSFHMMGRQRYQADKTLRPRLRSNQVGIHYGGRRALRKRFDNAILIGVPMAGTLACPFWFWMHDFTLIEVSAFVIGYIVIGLGVGVGLHRYFTHRSFIAQPWLAWLLGAAGTMAFQGSVLRWVIDHRRHHAHTDVCGDVHSPFVDSDCRTLSSVRGLFNAHIGWMFDDAVTDPRIFGKDLLHDRIVSFYERSHWVWVTLSLAAPWLWGFTLGGIEHAWGCLLFGGCFRTTLFHNVVWAVNSFGHSYGYQTYELSDGSRNNMVLAWATFGEGWHNNHHRYPRSAFHGLTRKEFDINGLVIQSFERLGWVSSVIYAPDFERKTNR